MDLLNTKCTYQNWSNYEVKGIVLQTAKSTQNLGPQFQGLGANYKVNSGKCQTLFFWAPKSLQMVTAAMKLKNAYSLEGKL